MKPLRGVAAGGESIDPSALSSEEEVDKSEKPKSAPAPGLPVSVEEYRRMTEAARHAPAPRDEHAQEDHPREEQGND